MLKERIFKINELISGITYPIITYKKQEKSSCFCLSPVLQSRWKVYNLYRIEGLHCLVISVHWPKANNPFYGFVCSLILYIIDRLDLFSVVVLKWLAKSGKILFKNGLFHFCWDLDIEKLWNKETSKEDET